MEERELASSSGIVPFSGGNLEGKLKIDVAGGAPIGRESQSVPFVGIGSVGSESNVMYKTAAREFGLTDRCTQLTENWPKNLKK